MTEKFEQGSALHSLLYEHTTLRDVVLQHKPAKPLYVLFPDIIKATARTFTETFPGTALFAVKTNPDPAVLKALGQGGVKAFDVASLEEIKCVRRLFPRAALHFMHTVKTPEDIRAAYFEYDVRHFVLDHEDELYKIMRETDLAQDLNLTVRIALPKNDTALIDFSNKFGASHAQAIDLLKKCRPVSRQLAISFHVGTQTTNTKAYAQAVAYCAALMKASGVSVDTLNVGGGFPVAYEGDENTPSIQACIHTITQALHTHNLSHLSLMAEPGRVLVAQGAKLVTRVELRKDDLLYINDGVYGGLFDAAQWVGSRYPVSAISCDRPFDGTVQPFKLAGPTCDSLDMMNGPFILPGDIGIGDWIVFDNAGAYSQSLRSDFNGFGHADIMCLKTEKQKDQ